MTPVVRLILMLLMLSCALPALANDCAMPGKDGVGTVTGIVNSYWPGTADANSGATSISLGAGNGSTPITAGDLLVVIQMQDAVIDGDNDNGYGDGVGGDPASGATNVNSSGIYEFVRATNSVSMAGGAVSIVGANGGGLLNSYDNQDATSTRGQRRFQVVRVPQYRSATLGANLTALRWNGRIGGVLAIDVAATLDLAGGTANVSGLGFRGGGGRQMDGDPDAPNNPNPPDYRSVAGNVTPGDNNNSNDNDYHGAKGEGIAGTPRYVNDNGVLMNTGVEGYPGGSNARGAPGTAGGGGTDGNPDANDQNTGGGGGAGYGSGGRGGHAWCASWQLGNCPTTGGFGGSGVTSLVASRLLPGGGGGAGTSNNGTGIPGSGFASSGAAGGGIIIVRAGALIGSGTLRADGADANSTVDNDGNGGGGGGGSVLVSAQSVAGLGLTLSAAGGRGGSNTHADAHGPGGGGGGGFVATNFGAAANVSGGANGTTSNGAYGSTSGSSGSSTLLTPSAVPGISAGGECSPQITKSFNATSIGQGGVSRMTITVSNRNPNRNMSALAFTDTYPAGLFNAAPPAVASTCNGSTAAAAGSGNLALNAGTLAANASCSIAVNVTSSILGDKVNTLAAGAVSATLGGSNVVSQASASATLSVTPPLTVTKTAVTISDPMNGTNNPKAIPGATVEYTLVISNPIGSAVDNVTIADGIPAEIALIIDDIGAAGSGPVGFTDGSPASGLSYSFISLGSAGDGLEFSDNGGSTWNYVPTPDANGLAPTVTHIRIRPQGSLGAGRNFTLRFRARVE